MHRARHFSGQRHSRDRSDQRDAAQRIGDSGGGRQLAAARADQRRSLELQPVDRARRHRGDRVVDNAARSPVLPRPRAHGAAVGLRFSSADAANAGLGRRLRPADPPGLRAVLPPRTPPADAVRSGAALLRAHRRSILDVVLCADRARRRIRRADRRAYPAGPDLGLPDLQLFHVARAAVLRPMTITGFLTQLLELAIAVALAPLLVGWVNMCRAWLQNKSAPSLFLPYRTIRKLFMKDAVVAQNASGIFRTTPYIVF